MTNFEMLQNAMANLNRINNLPAENQEDIKALRRNVSLLNKAVMEIIKRFPQEQQDKIKAAVNGIDITTSQAK